MKILAIECSEAPASCAVFDDESGLTLCESFASVGLTHSRTLMPMVGSMLKNAELDLKSIDRFAVSVGPGSFTGLRIGIAAVKGMALGTGKECVGVSTLHAAALGAVGLKGIICPVMDARCNQVYNALFYCDGASLRRICDDRALMIDELGRDLESKAAEYAGEDIIVTGNAADLVMSRLKGVPNLKAAPRHVRSQRASYVAAISSGYESASGDKLLPTYLRLPQAERELKKRTQG